VRLIRLIPAAFILFVAGPAFSQGWIEYASRADFFSVNFPGEPKVQDITYSTEYGITLPGRVYSREEGPNRYSVTVVDYADAEKIHTARARSCQAAGGDGDSCNNPWRADVRGAIVHATSNFLQRDTKVTHYANYNADLVEGHRLQLTNADRSRTFAVIHLHENRLYILEGTVAPGLPPPALFQQSLGFLDREGKRIRYETTYSHGFPTPRRTR
jgi:hypothetical protein